MRRPGTVQRRSGETGVAAIIAMMFLVIFGSLAAAMAIVAQGNLSNAQAHIKINRALAAAETGMRFLMYRINRVTATIRTRDGIIDEDNAPALWTSAREALLADFANDYHNLADPYEVGTALHLGPIAVGPNSPTFTAILTPHPLSGEDYDSAYYQRPPYSDMATPVSDANPLDVTWVRVRVEAADGAVGHQITRSIQMDFRIDKKIRFAILSRSRVMIGRNVMVEGPIGSRFTDTHLPNGHPIQMRSDFRGLDSELDTQLDALIGTLILNDSDGDNRINLADSAEIDGMTNPQSLDTNYDGYVDDYDFFIGHYDANGDGHITALELGADTQIEMAQLLQLIDTFGDPERAGYGDGLINNLDRYAKIRGHVILTADMSSWNDGAADGAYQDYFAGPILPRHGEAPLTFQASDAAVHDFEASDFDVSTFHNLATGDLMAQATQQAALHNPADPDSPGPLGGEVFEEVPYGAAHPYDHYHRPVYENMTFNDVCIPKGTNALFRNCTFVGVTFIETETDNDDPAFNFAGMLESDGSPRFPYEVATVDGQSVSDTKTVSNNIRFDNCRLEGPIISGAADGTQPLEYTQVRNKIAFTGRTQFLIDESENLTADEKELFKRSTILSPHYSVEMGTFVDPSNPNERVELSGTIVAGVIDIRGQVDITGTLLTTFEPQNNTGPVLADTSPQFNTTLGYFASTAGDLEAELPYGGIGVISIRYDPTIPLPDGILGPIEILPVVATYFEGGAQ